MAAQRLGDNYVRLPQHFIYCYSTNIHSNYSSLNEYCYQDMLGKVPVVV